MLSDQAKCSTDRSLAKLNIKQNEKKKKLNICWGKDKKRKISAKKIEKEENDEKIEKCK